MVMEGPVYKGIASGNAKVRQLPDLKYSRMNTQIERRSKGNVVVRYLRVARSAAEAVVVESGLLRMRLVRPRRCWTLSTAERLARPTLAAAQDLHVLGDDVHAGALVALLIFPLARLDAAFNVRLPTLLQVLRADFAGL